MVVTRALTLPTSCGGATSTRVPISVLLVGLMSELESTLFKADLAFMPLRFGTTQLGGGAGREVERCRHRRIGFHCHDAGAGGASTAPAHRNWSRHLTPRKGDLGAEGIRRRASAVIACHRGRSSPSGANRESCRPNVGVFG